MSDANTSDSSKKSTEVSRDPLSALRSFSLRKEIANAREKVNDVLGSLAPKRMASSAGAEGVIGRVKEPLYTALEYCQTNFPWAATVARSHSPEIIAAYAISTYAFCWKYMRKWAVLSTVSSVVYAAVGTTVINFKWYFPRDGK